MEVKVSIEMSAEHARAVMRACELMTRLGLGQIEYLADAVRVGEIRFYDSVPHIASGPHGASSESRLQAEESIDGLCTLIKSRLGFQRGASRGSGNKNNAPVVPLCWEVRNALNAVFDTQQRVVKGLLDLSDVSGTMTPPQYAYSGFALPGVRLTVNEVPDATVQEKQS